MIRVFNSLSASSAACSAGVIETRFSRNHADISADCKHPLQYHEAGLRRAQLLTMLHPATTS